MSNYYVYIYWRLDTNEPFYIGMGKDRRWREIYKGHRNTHFLKIADKHLIACEIIKDGLTEEQAHDIECWLINELVFEYGFSINIPNNRSPQRNIYHLVNCTWGGEGCSGLNPYENKTEEEMKEIGRKISEKQIGRKIPDETRKKISQSQKGIPRPESSERMKGKNNPMYGKHPSEETLKKMSESMMGKNSWRNNSKAKSVICLTTKKIFFTVKDAKDFYGIKSCSNIIDCCKGKKFYRGEWHNVYYGGKLKDGTKLKWRYLTWRHNKRYRINS